MGERLFGNLATSSCNVVCNRGGVSVRIAQNAILVQSQAGWLFSGDGIFCFLFFVPFSPSMLLVSGRNWKFRASNLHPNSTQFCESHCLEEVTHKTGLTHGRLQM